MKTPLSALAAALLTAGTCPAMVIASGSLNSGSGFLAGFDSPNVNVGWELEDLGSDRFRLNVTNNGGFFTGGVVTGVFIEDIGNVLSNPIAINPGGVFPPTNYFVDVPPPAGPELLQEPMPVINFEESITWSPVDVPIIGTSLNGINGGESASFEFDFNGVDASISLGINVEYIKCNPDEQDPTSDGTSRNYGSEGGDLDNRTFYHYEPGYDPKPKFEFCEASYIAATTVQIVPEPSSTLLVGLAGLGLLARRRK